MLLPAAFRSLSRPSSASGAKASALCSFLLNLLLHLNAWSFKVFRPLDYFRVASLLVNHLLMSYHVWEVTDCFALSCFRNPRKSIRKSIQCYASDLLTSFRSSNVCLDYRKQACVIRQPFSDTSFLRMRFSKNDFGFIPEWR